MKIVLTSIALALATTSAYAADAIIEEPVAVIVPDTFSWTGGYIGINAGYAGGKFKHPFEFGFDEEFAANGSLDVTSSGFVGGVQAGYNYQFDNGFVLGAEADFQGSNIKGEVKFNANDGFEGISGKAGTKVEWFGTVRARLGYTATERLLVYGTGGLAYGKVKSYADYDFDGEGGGISSSKTKAGWTVGAGAEYAFTDNWTIKSEYLYTDLGKRNLISYNDGEGSSFSLDNKVKFHTVRVGLNYKF
ncbi:outer membrane protein [Ochrobactrum sp. S1502_03]|uniref:outer membrane protein n=1 Tax=Ochrobactrum sp. S1502_03 TaxID=3108451 RepID=UPI0037C911F1